MWDIIESKANNCDFRVNSIPYSRKYWRSLNFGGLACHWNFGPGKIGPGTKISAGKNGPPDHIFW